MNTDIIVFALIVMAISAGVYAWAWIATRLEARRLDKMRAD